MTTITKERIECLRGASTPCFVVKLTREPAF